MVTLNDATYFAEDVYSKQNKWSSPSLKEFFFDKVFLDKVYIDLQTHHLTWNCNSTIQNKNYTHDKENLYVEQTTKQKAFYYNRLGTFGRLATR